MLNEQQIQSIPSELRQLDQWVAFRLDNRGEGKPTKIPVDPSTGLNASTSDPATWGSFAQALTRAEKDFLPGVGFVFSENDPFVGIDFDDCLDAKNGRIDEEVKRYLDLLSTYTEVSPSVTGVKAIVRGHIAAASVGPVCEIYPYKRFFAITGLRLPGYPDSIGTPGDALEELIAANGGPKTAPGQTARIFGWQDDKLQGVSAGERHGTAISLAGRWLRMGMSIREASFFISMWNEVNQPPKESLRDPDGREVQDIIAYVLRKQCVNTSKALFPRTHFPWEVLPYPLVISLNQLARSYATSPNSLPGAAVAILASVLGSTVTVKPKASWEEPLIIWACDIRDSGAGKLSGRALTEVIEAKQRRANLEYKLLIEAHEQIPKGERGAKPEPARGYLVTDLTLEGLAKDVSHHGGKICVLDEMSYFINSQNQYKGGRGSDRESWLRLHDGKLARIARSSGSVAVDGARISMFGGIQPKVWREAFKTVFELQDGTVFRLCPTIEGSITAPLTVENWSEENKRVWENLVNRAALWADDAFEKGERRSLLFDNKAFVLFADWRNELYEDKVNRLPPQTRGFVPKAVGYAARFAGILHRAHRFIKGEPPGDSLNVDEVKRGIRMAEFYLGHAVQAAEILASDYDLLDRFQQDILDAVLSLEARIENGRLPTHLVASELGLDPEDRGDLTRIGMAAKALGLTNQPMSDGQKRGFRLEPEELDRLKKWQRCRTTGEIPPLETPGTSDTFDTFDTLPPCENEKRDGSAGPSLSRDEIVGHTNVDVSKSAQYMYVNEQCQRCHVEKPPRNPEELAGDEVSKVSRVSEPPAEFRRVGSDEVSKVSKVSDHPDVVFEES